MHQSISETKLKAATNKLEADNAARRAEVLAEENDALLEFVEFKERLASE